MFFAPFIIACCASAQAEQARQQAGQGPGPVAERVLLRLGKLRQRALPPGHFEQGIVAEAGAAAGAGGDAALGAGGLTFGRVFPLVGSAGGVRISLGGQRSSTACGKR